MIIEKLKIEDIQGLLDLYIELTPYNNSINKSIEIYKEILKDGKYLLLVAKENNTIVGSALAVCCLVLDLEKVTKFYLLLKFLEYYNLKGCPYILYVISKIQLS